MKKEIPELSKLELNQKNVMELLFKAKATPKTKNPTISNFYTDNSSRKAPSIQLDEDIVLSHCNLIRYWLGQVKAIHSQQTTMTPASGIITYQDKPWTNDNRALFALYYLSVSSTEFPRFEDGPTSAIATELDSYYALGLRPTFSPNDPRFNIQDAKKALKDLGVSIDEQTHVD